MWNVKFIWNVSQSRGSVPFTPATTTKNQMNWIIFNVTPSSVSSANWHRYAEWRDRGLPFDFRGKYRRWLREIVEMSRRMFRKQVLARYWNAPRVRSKSLFTGTLHSVYASCFPPTLLSFSERKATVWIGHSRFIIFLHFRRSSLIIRSSVLLLFVSLYGSFRWSLFPSLMLRNFT